MIFSLVPFNIFDAFQCAQMNGVPPLQFVDMSSDPLVCALDRGRWSDDFLLATDIGGRPARLMSVGRDARAT